MTDTGAVPAAASGRAPAPAPPLLEPSGSEQDDVVWQELQLTFAWYDRRAKRNRIAYQTVKVTNILLAAAVTVLAAQHAPSWLTATLAAVVVALEGVQQLFQLHANWISYRGSAETLRQEAFAYVARVAPYDTAQRRTLLANAVRGVTAKERTSWAKTMQQPA